MSTVCRFSLTNVKQGWVGGQDWAKFGQRCLWTPPNLEYQKRLFLRPFVIQFNKQIGGRHRGTKNRNVPRSRNNRILAKLWMRALRGVGFDWKFFTSFAIPFSIIFEMFLICAGKVNSVQEACDKCFAVSFKSHGKIKNRNAKVRSCYHVSITSYQAAKNFFIRSKNKSKIAVLLILSNQSAKNFFITSKENKRNHQKLQFTSKEAVLKFKKFNFANLMHTNWCMESNYQ